ncbi:hypothetical protein ACPOL_5478 [Acidisarcina polymorpha]|uniref:Uncharacterized protein n=1 Tax=Acidisarcina polymorpha TaxID=2211140 RepID=A0A2Z5G826_9BACT|nr:hypothetical protein [Acidisarcina polymorpha]AXC14726.1 hypothetical protein ACPOL_5478 [Acidisarcina polymorpha]
MINARVRRQLLAASAFAVVAMLSDSAAFLSAQPSAPNAASSDPAALVRRASQNELRPSSPPYPVRYKLRKQDEKGVTTKEIVETKDGDVARLIAKNDKPLTPQENQAELDRLNNLLAHPEIQEHRHKREQEDSGRADEMTKLLPDAFLYTYLGTVPGPNGPAHRLSFKPNPNFNPPDREAEVYHGMEGELWLDQAQERIVKLDAHLIADVNFGWGILGKLYKGGSLSIEQKDVGHRHWEATLLKLNLTGIALMVKPLSFQTTETSTDFEPVPVNMSYQDAVHMLESDSIGAQVAQGTAIKK